ncbi:hypothetical protein [Tunturiibacter lichenicola]|uniref:hypothetical protein n=1 Tax=Tunturiibacter lichenicola TaxID=2051959 RepID=UPI003D9B35C9
MSIRKFGNDALVLALGILVEPGGRLALETLNELNEDVLQLPDDLISESVQQNYYRDRLEVWSEILRTRGRLNKGKAARLKIAQALLALGMTTVAFLLFVMIRTILR